MLLAAALASSTNAAFCWVPSSSCITVLLTWSMPALCSALAAEISAMMSVTRFTEATTSVMVVPARLTRVEPCSTSCTESEIRALISLAAAAERCASVRTSEATTAKPRPCSPARAASTAALSARMLVWKAMPSITPMMSAMRADAALIEAMVATTSSTARPPFSATSPVLSTSWLAWRALSAFCFTVDVSSSIEAAVSSRLAAWCSVRTDRSLLPLAISLAAVLIEPTARWMPCTMPVSCSAVRLAASASLPNAPS
ncbi:hypothetical protein NB713_001305 [Xanthomonas sacchari]|nr:hypothetical protein [Xanthomonas sacchari]